MNLNVQIVISVIIAVAHLGQECHSINFLDSPWKTAVSNNLKTGSSESGPCHPPWGIEKFHVGATGNRGGVGKDFGGHWRSQHLTGAAMYGSV